jgi:hypothetical protein
MERSPKLQKEYDIPVDRTTKILTAIGLLLALLPIIIFAYFEVLFEQVYIAILTFIAISLIAVYLYSPKKIVVESDKIIIKKVLGYVEIPYSSVKEVLFLSKPKMLRLLGSSGFFGYFGLFSVEGEKVWVYARRSDNMVLIKADRNYLIAPEDIDNFVNELKEKIGGGG